MGDLLPVLVADLANEERARVLEEVSLVGGEAWVPLVTAPEERRPHLLEIYTPSCSEPLRLLAEPLGAAGEQGHPLRLFPYDPSDAPLDEELEAAVSAAEEAAHEGQVTPADPLVGRTIAGDKLAIESLIGAGSIGAVYLARHRGLQLPIAVKVLHRAFQHDVEFCRRFYAEALAMSRLDHPNVVRVQDFGQEPDGLLYLSMAFLDGKSLRTILGEERRLEPKRAVEIMLQVSAGLSHAHARGLVHRDVKADNVMIVVRDDDDGGRREQAKVCDFGFAVPPSVTASVAQRLAGTPVYMSPEQCRGEELDARTDLYACGILLYELLTGEVPFLSDDMREIMQMHMSAPPPLVASKRPGIDPRLERIVQKALAKEREHRHANLQELRVELKAALIDDTPVEGLVTAPVLSSPPPPPRPRRPSSPEPERPDWLETSQGYTTFLTEMDSARGDELADTLARDPKPWLRKLAHESDPRAFATMTAHLDRAIRSLSQRADVRALFVTASALHGLASEPGPRAAPAAATLALFGDPEILAPLAERYLSRNDDVKESARALLTNARGAGAYALYGARVKLGGDAYVRVTFVTTMQKLAEHAWPVVRAALGRIPDSALSGGHPVAAEVAEDLLLCVPAVRDDAAADLVARYASAVVPGICRAAARAITRVSPDRAAPLLLRLLEVRNEGVVTAALVGLREVDGVDVQSLRGVAPLLSTEASSPTVRAAAIAALAASRADARPLAAKILAGLLVEAHADDATVLAAARALLAIAPDAHAVVRERAAASTEPLRSHLASLVGE